eukprot:300754-Chlamydomonas_euryale.AAC.1
MRKLKNVAEEDTLFIDEQGQYRPASQRFALYYDPPYERLSMKGVQSTAKAQTHETDMPEGMLFRFRCNIMGAAAVVAADSQASHCFISKAFVEQHGIPTTPVHRMVELADGTLARTSEECRVRLHIKAAD